MAETSAETLMQNGIAAYLHCAQCLQECPSYMSAAGIRSARLWPNALWLPGLVRAAQYERLPLRSHAPAPPRVCHARRGDGTPVRTRSHPRVPALWL